MLRVSAKHPSQIPERRNGSCSSTTLGPCSRTTGTAANPWWCWWVEDVHQAGTSVLSPKIVLYSQRPRQKVLSVGGSNGCCQGGDGWYSSLAFTKRARFMNSLLNRGYGATITVFSRISAHPQRLRPQLLRNQCRLIISYWVPPLIKFSPSKSPFL